MASNHGNPEGARHNEAHTSIASTPLRSGPARLKLTRVSLGIITKNPSRSFYSSVARAREGRFFLGIHPKVPEVLSRVFRTHIHARAPARAHSLALVSDVPVDVHDSARALTARPFRRDCTADAARGA